MKRYKVLLSMVLCIVFTMTSAMVFADTTSQSVLTLEEAKKVAFENDTQVKLQPGYINQKSDDYEDAVDKYDKEPTGPFRNKAAKIAAQVTYAINIENAAFAYEKEVFKRDDLKRASDYNVTTAYYELMKSKLALDDSKRSLDLAKKDLDIAKIKYELGLITKSSLDQTQNACVSTQTSYNKAASDVQNDIAALSKEMGKGLSAYNNEIDMTISIPDVKSLDLNKIKADYLEKNETYFTLGGQLRIVKLKQTFTQEKYDEYLDKDKNISRNSDNFKDLEDLMYNANRDYEDTQYQYDDKVRSLNVTLDSQFSAINTLAETVENLKKNLEDARISFTQSKTKYDLGMISKYELDKSESALKSQENMLTTNIINLNSQYLSLTQYSYKKAKK